MPNEISQGRCNYAEDWLRQKIPFMKGKSHKSVDPIWKIIVFLNLNRIHGKD
jgi:hypothetical protein